MQKHVPQLSTTTYSHSTSTLAAKWWGYIVSGTEKTSQSSFITIWALMQVIHQSMNSTDIHSSVLSVWFLNSVTIFRTACAPREYIWCGSLLLSGGQTGNYHWQNAHAACIYSNIFAHLLYFLTPPPLLLSISPKLSLLYWWTASATQNNGPRNRGEESEWTTTSITQQ